MSDTKPKPEVPTAQKIIHVNSHPFEIVDYATGVKGTFCIAQKVKGAPAFRAFWNPSGWAGSGYVFHDRAIVEAVVAFMQKVQSCQKELNALRSLLNRPEIDNFIEGVRTEAAHQLQRWGAEHDRTKTPEDWYWTVGYLAGKALHSQRAEDYGKFMHHLITAAAVLSNWHHFASNPNPQEWESKL